jgi:RimJ/RimL family protein N-acetyltransferase
MVEGLNSLNNPELTDGVIFLRPHIPEDAADHLAGEDDAMAKWLNGGHSTLATVATFIENSQHSWRTGGPRRPFGVLDCASRRLIGFVEVNLARLCGPGQVNVSYGIFQEWRGRGLALRAIDLMGQYLQMATEARQMVLRIAPANTASLRVAEKGGFTLLGEFDEPEGRLVRYARDVRS